MNSVMGYGKQGQGHSSSKNSDFALQKEDIKSYPTRSAQKKTNYDLFAHKDGARFSAYISTTPDRMLAAHFAEKENGGWVFFIEPPLHIIAAGSNLNADCQSSMKNNDIGFHFENYDMRESEVAILKKIPRENIIGAQKINSKTKEFGPFIKNPFYKPKTREHRNNDISNCVHDYGKFITSVWQNRFSEEKNFLFVPPEDGRYIEYLRTTIQEHKNLGPNTAESIKSTSLKGP